jgi:hypothetical protein
MSEVVYFILIKLKEAVLCMTCELILSGCLKLLPPEKLEQLEIPVEEESSLPIGKVLYMSATDASLIGGNATLSQLRAEDTSFNLFTGNQTFEERDRSFEVIGAAYIIFAQINFNSHFLLLVCPTGYAWL